MTELFVVASALKYRGIAGPSPAGLWVNSIVTVAAAVVQPPCLAAMVIGAQRLRRAGLARYAHAII